MGFADAVKLGFANYANFLDRACRSEFWYWTLFVFVGEIVTRTIGRPVFLLFFLAILLPSLSVSVRRLHDLDRSGWWILLNLIPLVGPIILIIWFSAKGTDGPNRFGADRLLSPGQIAQQFD